MSFSKKTWINYATIQSLNYSKETTKKNTDTNNKINKKSNSGIKNLLKKLY